MTMNGGTVLDSVKMLACMLGGCNIWLQWSINGVQIETFPSCSVIESRRGCGFQTRGCDSVDDNEQWNCVGYRKNLACMMGGCNIGLQWSINGVLIETFPSCSGIESRRGYGYQTRG